MSFSSHQWLSADTCSDDRLARASQCAVCGAVVEYMGRTTYSNSNSDTSKEDRNPMHWSDWLIANGHPESLPPCNSTTTRPHHWHTVAAEQFRDERGRFMSASFGSAFCAVLECYFCDARIDQNTDPSTVSPGCPVDSIDAPAYL